MSFFDALLGLHIVNHAADGLDIAVEDHRLGEEIQIIVLVVLKIHVQRQVIDVLVALRRGRQLPIAGRSA